MDVPDGIRRGRLAALSLLKQLRAASLVALSFGLPFALADEQALNPLDADPDWHIPPPPAEDRAAPPHRDYQLLNEELGRLLAVASSGGWPAIAAGEPLALGARDPRVETLRARLRASGDYDSEMGADPWFFDSGMDTALRRFQQRHEIPPDGIFGDRTRDAVNVPVEERMGQLAVTMERWRWLPRDLGPRYVWVNIPRSLLDVVENGQSILTMRISLS